MNYVVGDHRTGTVVVKDIDRDALEEALREYHRGNPSDLYRVIGRTSVSLVASVIRDGRTEVVRLKSGAKEINIPRRTEDHEGGAEALGVSCDPDGAEVPVDTINVPFRDYHDPLALKGIVWVVPGSPAAIQMDLSARVLETEGMIERLLQEAETAAEEKVFQRLR